MMDHFVSSVAYYKRPKSTKKTSFQEELQLAVSSRALVAKAEQHHYDNYNDSEDDFLNKLIIESRKKRNAFKAGRTKAKNTRFEFSDDEDPSHSKRVSFLKTDSRSSQSRITTTPEPLYNEPLEETEKQAYSFSSTPSTQPSEANKDIKNSGSENTEAQLTRENSNQTFDSSPLPLPSDNSVETPAAGVKTTNSAGEQSFQSSSSLSSHPNHTYSPDHVKEPPKPKPRQKTFGLTSHAPENEVEELASQDLSVPQTSSTSIPLSTDTCSILAWTDEDQGALPQQKLSSHKSKRFTLKSTWDSDSKDYFNSGDSKEPQKNYSSSFEEIDESSRDPTTLHSHSPEKSLETRTSSSQTNNRPQSECSRRAAEAKYLGSLRVLDRRVSLQEPRSVNSLRATVYQEWLRKKNEKSKEELKLKKKEELRKEKEKEKQKAKREEAIASYEAWKENKVEFLKTVAKEKKDHFQKEQKTVQEKQEKSQSAQEVFEKWKREHDHLRREKRRKEKEKEDKLKAEKQQMEEERKRESKSAFSVWCEKKKDVLHEKVIERKATEKKTITEIYLREEKEKKALQVYESWLRRKELELKRQKEERRIQAILGDSPPPPWSPPNKTVPFRK